MAVLIDQEKKVIVQGITGREGRARTKLMKSFGTNIIGGCTPGKGGQEVEGVFVHNSVSEVIDSVGPVDISVIFVPARLVKLAAIEAIEAGIKLLVLVPDRVPTWDAIEIAERAVESGANFIGPNTLGIISPGKGVLGMIGGRAESARDWFLVPGSGRATVGVISRSGGMTSSCGYYLSQKGLAMSTLCHVGGDSVIGMPIPEVALLMERDYETEAIVIFGEIGGSQEERLASLMLSGLIKKPVIAYIGGKAAKEGTRFSHAGAIIEGGRGTHRSKVKILRDAGAKVVDEFGELPAVALSALGFSE